MTTIPRPAPAEFSPYYTPYVDRVPDGDLLDILEQQHAETASLIGSLPEERGSHRYAPGKWSIREVLGHLADAERIFAYRALRVARGDATPLSGFDENVYVENARFDTRTLSSLLEELRIVREASVALFRSLDEDELARGGTANGAPITARALAWIIAGHEAHHLAILRQRYL